MSVANWDIAVHQKGATGTSSVAGVLVVESVAKSCSLVVATTSGTCICCIRSRLLPLPQMHVAIIAFQPSCHAACSLLQSSVQFLKKGSLNRTRNSGLACVTVSNADDVEASCRALDSELVHGRPMIVRKDKFVQDQSGYSPGTAAEVRLSCSGQPAKQ